MGIRINKVLGYGLTNVKCNDGIITDSRFNHDGILFNRIKYNLSGYIDHIKNCVHDNSSSIHDEKYNLHLVLSALKKDHLSNFDFNNIIHHDDEFGLDNVICFIPPSMKRWYRYDDDIDYYMEYSSNQTTFAGNTTCYQYQQSSKCQELDGSIYPFYGYINKFTGKKATLLNDSISYLRSLNDLIITEQNKTTQDITKIKQYQQSINDELKHIGCINHWSERYTPVIPGDLIQYLLYTKTFKDSNTIWQLKPMIYTYWS